MKTLWSILPLLLTVVSSMVVVGQTTRKLLEKSDTTEPSSAVTSIKALEQTTRKSLERSDTTEPSSAVTSIKALEQTTRKSLEKSDTTEPSSAVTSIKALEQTTRKSLERSDSTEPVSTGVTQSPSSYSESRIVSLASLSPLSPTRAPTGDTTRSPDQLTSTKGIPTTGTLFYSTTGHLSQASQNVNSSIPGHEAETNSSQETSFSPRTEHWTTDDLVNDTGIPEIISFSTPVTNASGIDGFIVPGVQEKTQSPPTSVMTSSKRQPPDFHSTAATTSTTSNRGNVTSIIPLVNEVTKVTTRNYKRLTTAEAATKKIGLVTQCLIVIAILAGICTIFVICTIVLCTKLSSQRHNYRVNQMNGTELICISALLPEEERKMRKKLRPKRLKDFKESMARQTSDTDDDDLTLQSFVTEH
ncbi:P-selectin glycoprotein ligand 1 [Narcine bancroftii]|uniref:P-selectin glycoprotein ligand 1 n=1 Tax=Narcine bancroftii TaxID=1343680 RepID=UPI003831B4E3